MPKQRTIYICQQCNSQSPRWQGRCNDCGAWDSMTEQMQVREATSSGTTRRRQTTTNAPQALPDIATGGFARLPVYGEEFTRVLGGGLVPGSLTLIGGDPGIGKSSLLLTISGHFAAQVGSALYVSGEESGQQIKLRALRLGLEPQELYVLSETNLEQILAHIVNLRPQLVIIDSIQTVYVEDLTAAAGSVSQVRECAMRLLRLAKETNTPIFLVGHVTKEGTIAGPRVLEHIVDVVLYLEGDRFHQYRLLRGVKNRFGSTNEVGVFEMRQEGLIEVTNPSQVFLAERSAGTPGSTVAVTMEGTRPILVEVQALTSHTNSAQPRRTANGFDMNRLLMLVAVLSKRVGMPLFNQDVYVNIVGGLRISEPAADLAVATAIASSFRNQRIDPDLVLVGEVGLSGELRGVGQIERRLAEAAKLGFKRSFYSSPSTAPSIEGFEAIGARSLADVVRMALVGPPERQQSPRSAPVSYDADDAEDEQDDHSYAGEY